MTPQIPRTARRMNAYTSPAPPVQQQGESSTGYGIPGPSYSAPPAALAWNPNAGYGAQYYGYQIGAQDPSMSYRPDLDTSDPDRLFRNAQNVNYNMGAGINSDLYNQGKGYGGQYAKYGNLMDAAYTDLKNTPGYTDQELKDLGMTSNEAAGIKGNTDSYFNYLNPGRFSEIESQSDVDQLKGVDTLRNAYGDAYNPLEANSGKYRFDSGDVINTALTGLAHDNSVYLNDPALQLSEDYTRKAGMSDAEVQQMADAGARDVGLRYQSQRDANERAARASGSASPVAIAAANERLLRDSSVDSADARVNAELAARSAQRNAATGVEQTRLNQQNYVTGQRVGAANDLAAKRLAANEYQTGLNLNENQNLYNAKTGAAQNVQQADAARAQNMAGLRSGNAQYVQSTGTGVSQAADTAGSNRAQTMYGNRSGVVDKGAQARMAGQGEYRNWTGNQTGQQLGAVQTNNQQRIQNYGTMSGAMNNNAAQWADNKTANKGMGFGTAFKQGLGGALGKTLGGQ